MAAAKRPPNVIETTPSGIEIAFWDQTGVDGEPQQRRYRVNDERFVNITTITGVLDKSDALIPWAVALAEQGIDWREVRNDAAGRGTDAHAIVLNVVMGRRSSLSDLRDEHRAWGQAAYRWLKDRRPKATEAERMVAAPSHGYAGRIDLLGELQGLDGLALVEFKTVSKWSYKRDKKGQPTDELLPPYEENLLQLDLQAGAIEESGYPTPDRGLIVRLGPDGAYDETEVQLLPDRGLGILEAYRCKGAAGRALKNARAREKQERPDALAVWA